MAGRILIVDDVATNRVILKVRLTAAFHDTLLAEDGATALRLMAETPPDLVILDLQLPDIHGLEVLAQMRAAPATRDVPVIVVTASRDTETRLACLRAGADEVFAKPADDQLLLARVRCLLRRRQSPGESLPFSTALAGPGLAEDPAPYARPGLVAVVLARTETGLLLKRDLARLSGHRVTLLSREDALADTAPSQPTLPGQRPEAFVIDASGERQVMAFSLLSELRANAIARHAGIALLCDSPAQAAMALDLGADEVAVADMSAHELSLRIDGLVRRARQAESRRANLRDNLRLAMTDPLTGLHNRRAGLVQLANIAEAAQMSGQGFAVMIVDLDRFKGINDRFGHAAGDAVLVDVARSLSNGMRPCDLLARIGGEEFLIALPGLTLAQAKTVGERLCAAVKSSPIALPGGGEVVVTVSIGVAVAAADTGSGGVGTVMDCADRALLTAKSGGRNRVTIGRSAA